MCVLVLHSSSVRRFSSLPPQIHPYRCTLPIAVCGEVGILRGPRSSISWINILQKFAQLDANLCSSSQKAKDFISEFEAAKCTYLNEYDQFESAVKCGGCCAIDKYLGGWSAIKCAPRLTEPQLNVWPRANQSQREKLCLPPDMLAKEEADTQVSIGAAAL